MDPSLQKSHKKASPSKRLNKQQSMGESQNDSRTIESSARPTVTTSTVATSQSTKNMTLGRTMDKNLFDPISVLEPPDSPKTSFLTRLLIDFDEKTAVAAVESKTEKKENTAPNPSANMPKGILKKPEE
jgi:hypothetical protein